MSLSTCPICRNHRRHKLHTRECAKKARSLDIESFIGAYKPKHDQRDIPEFRENKR